MAADSVAAISDAGTRLLYGISLHAPKGVETVLAEPAGNAMSWIVACLIILFVVACMRYSKNAGYFMSIFHSVFEPRERSSSSDSTVRESSFLLILNLLWCVSTGILLYALVARTALHSPIVIWGATQVGAAAVCAGVAVLYTLFLVFSYQLVGSVFFDARMATGWVGSYLSAQAMAGVAMFPFAVIGFAVPAALTVMLVLGGIAFCISKIIFFYKGFRIFFNENASWVLFLYYLCSLEIVPMIFAYTIAANWTSN